MQLAGEFEEIKFDYIPREKNQIADALATLAAMIKLEGDGRLQPIHIKIEESPAFCNALESELDGRPWYHDIV